MAEPARLLGRVIEGARVEGGVDLRVLSGCRRRPVPQSICAGRAEAAVPLYTAFTIDELSLPLQKDNAIGVPGAQEWVNDLPNEQNKKFVADYRKKYPGLRPTYYGAQAYDAAQLINSAVVAVKGDMPRRTR